MTEETEEKVENVLQDLFWKLVELRVRDCLSLSFIIITDRHCVPYFARSLNFKGKLALKNILYSMLRLIFYYMQIVPPEEKKAQTRFLIHLQIFGRMWHWKVLFQGNLNH